MEKTALLERIAALYPKQNRLSVPRITKVTVNAGVGRLRETPGAIDEAIRIVSSITGQKPVTTRARAAIASFKVRKGEPVGVRVTLRGQRMHDFLTKLSHVTLPRIRDFRGIKKSAYDGQGTISIGIREHNAFPEIVEENVKFPLSLQVNITTTAHNFADCQKLLTAYDFPFTLKEEQ